MGLLREDFHVERAETVRHLLGLTLLLLRLPVQIGDPAASGLRFADIAVVRVDIVQHQEGDEDRRHNDDRIQRAVIAVRARREIEVERLH